MPAMRDDKTKTRSDAASGTPQLLPLPRRQNLHRRSIPVPGAAESAPSPVPVSDRMSRLISSSFICLRHRTSRLEPSKSPFLCILLRFLSVDRSLVPAPSLSGPALPALAGLRLKV